MVVKAVVAFVCVLDMFHFIFVIHATYWYMVSHFLQKDIVTMIPWSLWVSQILACCTDLIVRLFFLYRVWILSTKSTLLVYPVFVASFIPWFIFVTFSSIGLHRLHDLSAAWHYRWMFYTGIGIMTLEDLYFATSLSYYLYRARSDISSQTNSTVRVLILYTVNTGLISTIFSVISMITCATLRQSFVYLAMFLPMSQLYVNALLATLNARNWLRSDLGEIQIPLTSIFKQKRTKAQHQFIEMNIRTSKHQNGPQAASVSTVELEQKTDVVSTSDTLTEDGVNEMKSDQRDRTNDSLMITLVIGGEEKDIPISMN